VHGQREVFEDDAEVGVGGEDFFFEDGGEALAEGALEVRELDEGDGGGFGAAGG